MIPLVLIFGMFVIGGIALAIMVVRPRHRAWRQAAAELGLRVKTETLGGGSMSGVMGRHHIEICTVTSRTRSEQETHTRFEVKTGPGDASTGIERGISIGRETLLSVVGRALGGGDVQIGDKSFDADMLLRGDEGLLLAVLGSDARKRIVSLSELGTVACEDGVLTYEQSGVIDDATLLVQSARIVGQLACDLSPDDHGWPERLHDNLAAEPLAPVRQRVLELMVERYPDEPATVHALTLALTDPFPPLRLIAAERVGADGFDALRGLARESNVDLELRKSALSRLVRRFPRTAASDVLGELIHRNADSLTPFVVLGIAQLRESRYLKRLVALTPAADAALGQTLAQAFGQVSGARAEEALLLLLAHDATAVKQEAAHALGIVGTIRAVECLLPHTEGLLTSGELKAAARDAIRAIQSRLGPVEAGRLAVVDPAENRGRLAVVDDADGTGSHRA